MKQLCYFERFSKYTKITKFKFSLYFSGINFKLITRFKNGDSSSFFLGTVSEIKLKATNDMSRRYMYNDTAWTIQV